METVILAIVLVVLAMGGVAIGTFFGRAPIKGSCGGLACAEGVECACGKGGKG